jgi:hypothetical protein
MGLGFRRTLTLLPGVRLNVGLRGTSVSLGRRGASLTFGANGTYGNGGLPGTGLSYRTRLSPPRASSGAASRGRSDPRPAVTPASIDEIHLRIAEDGTCEMPLADGSVADADCGQAIGD